MNDDYLWNRSGPPDPDIQRLEQLLGRLRSVPPLPQLPEADAERPRRRGYGLLLATAAAIVLVITGTWRTMRAPAWEVASVAGQPRLGSETLARRGRIAVGETLATDSASQARITVSTIGEVTVDPDTRVRLVATRQGHHQLALERGTLHAVITAPPGQFIVSTRSAI